MCLSKIIIISIFVVFISSGVAKSINCNDGRFFLSNHSAKANSAHLACKKSGGTLAHISNENFSSATDLVFQCLGPNEDAWISSWNSNSEMDDCLTLSVGNTSPGGSVATKCNGKRYALCSTHKHSNTNGTKTKIGTSGFLSENQEKPSDLPLDSSLDLDSIIDEGDDAGVLLTSDSQHLDEEVSILPNIWHPGDDAGMARFNDDVPNDIAFIWGVGGDFMFGSPNDNDKSNDDTSNNTMSADAEEEEEEYDDNKNEEAIIEGEEMEESPANTNKVQQNTSWNSVEALLVDTDMIKDESDDDHVVQNA